MADTPIQSASVPEGQASVKTKKIKKAKNPKAKANPPTAEMVTSAIKGLKERGGSSLQAIKKYIAANYKVDAEKVAPFIKKYLKSAVISGSLVQTKGKGASGSFKLGGSASGEKTVTKKKKPPAKRSASGDKAKSGVKKSPKTKKATQPKKSGTTVAKKPAAAKPKSPSKAKKSKTGPTKKPKAPKPKTAKSKKAASPKKKK